MSRLATLQGHTLQGHPGPKKKVGTICHRCKSGEGKEVATLASPHPQWKRVHSFYPLPLPNHAVDRPSLETSGRIGGRDIAERMSLAASLCHFWEKPGSVIG